jgi:hypothetical protein
VFLYSIVVVVVVAEYIIVHPVYAGIWNAEIECNVYPQKFCMPYAASRDAT